MRAAEVRVCSVWATIDACGNTLDAICVEEVPVPPERAHRLAEAAEVSVAVAAASTSLAGRMVATRWLVAALGFIEAEAFEAYQSAVEDLLLNPSAHQPWSAVA